jgi:hypothetical protein
MCKYRYVLGERPEQSILDATNKRVGENFDLLGIGDTVIQDQFIHDLLRRLGVVFAVFD